MTKRQSHANQTGVPLRFHVLGNLEAYAGAVRLNLGGLKQRMVLAILLAEADRAVSVDRLIDGLWGESPPQRAVGTLQAYVSNLRRALEPERPPGAPAAILASQPPGYVLRVRADAVDALRFENLAATGRAALDAGDAGRADEVLTTALDLWRGPAFAEFAYEPALGAHITILENRRLGATEDLYEARLALGRHIDSVPALERLVAAEPMRERLRALFMVALYRSGRQAEALQSYADFSKLLAAELGVDPSHELRSLHEQIVRQDSSLEQYERRPAPAVAATSGDDRQDDSPADGRPLVGRTPELAVLTAVVARTKRGAGGVVVVEGEAGIGKSRVAAEVAWQAIDEGFLVVRSDNDEDAGGRYASWTQIVEYLDRLNLDATAKLSERTRHAMALAPTPVDGEWSLETTASTQDVADEVATLLHSFAAAQPLMVIQEDLHWADAGTLAVLQAAAKRTDSAALVIIATCRNAEAGSPALVDALAAIARLPAARRISLGGLSTSEIGELVRATTGVVPSNRVAEAIRVRTEGNPFFASELITLLSSEKRLSSEDPLEVSTTAVPGNVRDVVRRRLLRLPDDTQHLLSAAAVAGREFALDVAFEAADLDGDRALQATEAATLAGLLAEAQPGGGRYAFGHALVRETILEDLGPIGRARIHGRIADVLLRRHGEHGDHLIDVAWHLWRSAPTRPRDPTIPYLARAGELALARTDFEVADALLGRAAEGLRAARPRPDHDELELRVHYQLALVRGRTLGTRSALVQESVARVEELSRKLGRPAEVAHALWYSFSDELVRGDTARAAQIARRMLDEAERSSDVTALTLARASSGLAALDRGELASAREHLQTGVRTWRGHYGDGPGLADASASLFDPRAYRPDVMCLGYEAITAWLQGDDVRSQEALAEAYSATGGGRGGHAYPRGFAMYCRAWLDALRRDVAAVIANADDAVAFARARGLRFFAAASSIVSGWARALRGDAEAGLAQIQEGFAEGSSALGPMRRPFYLCMLAETDWRAGDAPGAIATIDEALETSHRMRSNRFIVPELHRLRALVLLDIDPSARDEAAATVAAGIEEARRQGSVPFERRAAETLATVRQLQPS